MCLLCCVHPTLGVEQFNPDIERNFVSTDDCLLLPWQILCDLPEDIHLNMFDMYLCFGVLLLE